MQLPITEWYIDDAWRTVPSSQSNCADSTNQDMIRRYYVEVSSPLCRLHKRHANKKSRTSVILSIYRV